MTDAVDETPRLTDAALAIGLAVFAQLNLRFNLDNSTPYGSPFAAAAVVAIATLALAWWRRRPLATLCVVVAATAIPELFTRLTVTLWGHFVPLLIAVYGLARWCASRRWTAVGIGLAVAAIVVLMLRVPSVGTASNIPFTLVPVTAAFVAGRVLRQRHAGHRELAARASQLEADRAAQIASAVADERARIARELHDIVAHCVSVMVVQAGASEDLLDRDPERARAPLRAVQETGRLAVAELGRMLGLLRDGGPARPDLAPQPGTEQLPELADRMSGLGLPVGLTVSGDPRPLPPGVELTAYRVVQEALTNTLKHGGPGVTARVEVRYLPRTLDVQVTDDGRTASTAGSGHGLIGMTERASICGGTIEACARPEGGFRVHLALPLDPP
ncbi:MAG: sensor histidine kinase [Intrasporangium sp.]|uniref:sensor histidine kinase n=1 Tax=Intrasporangium sp. TaxID=1925024 RepID=UPI003F7FE053